MDISFLYLIFCLFSDVITIEKTNEYFRLIYDVKGRFTIHRITPLEAKVCFSLLSCVIHLWGSVYFIRSGYWHKLSL